MEWRSRLTAVMLSVAAAACATTNEPGNGKWSIDYGLLLPTFPTSVLVILDTVGLGRAVAVTVNTFGSSSCLRPAGVEIANAGSRVQTLTPRDSVRSGPDVACTDDLATHPHAATLMFEHIGPTTLRVQGYLFEPDGTRRLGTVDRLVFVRP